MTKPPHNHAAGRARRNRRNARFIQKALTKAYGDMGPLDESMGSFAKFVAGAAEGVNFEGCRFSFAIGAPVEPPSRPKRKRRK